MKCHFGGCPHIKTFLSHPHQAHTTWEQLPFPHISQQRSDFRAFMAVHLAQTSTNNDPGFPRIFYVFPSTSASLSSDLHCPAVCRIRHLLFVVCGGEQEFVSGSFVGISSGSSVDGSRSWIFSISWIMLDIPNR